MSRSASGKSGHRVAVVGAGILGLAHALVAAERGHAVTVYERDARALGASVHNFGLGLVLGQPPELLPLALRSRERWLQLLPQIGAWHKAEGSVLVARSEAEWQVLQAFQADAGALYQTRLGIAAEWGLPDAGGGGALFSPHELALDAREALPALAHWLAEVLGVEFVWGTEVQAVDLPQLHTSAGLRRADEVIICSGHDYQTLGASQLAPLGLRHCRLQMLRLADPGLRLGPTLLTGLSTLHYPSFLQRPALAPALAALRAQVAADEPDLLAHGIHLIVQQVGRTGELIVGDSHHYADPQIEGVTPFSSEAVDERLLQLATAVLGRPLQVLQRWQGVYGSGPRPWVRQALAPGVQAVLATAGVGMSLAFGLAEQTWELTA